VIAICEDILGRSISYIISHEKFAFGRSASAMKGGKGASLSRMVIAIPLVGPTSQIGDRKGSEEISMANIRNCRSAVFHVLREKGPQIGF